MAFNPSGTRLAFVAMDNYHTVYVYDWRKKRELSSGRGQMGDPPQVRGGTMYREGSSPLYHSHAVSGPFPGGDVIPGGVPLPHPSRQSFPRGYLIHTPPPPNQVYGLEWNPYEISHQASPSFLTFGKKHIKVSIRASGWDLGWWAWARLMKGRE